MTSWDPDGSGPIAPRLVAGGQFQVAGATFASNIAEWDGVSWRPLGAGVDGRVLALTTYQGDLIAGGEFLNAGNTLAVGIARWNGASWQPLGSSGLNDYVTSLAVFGSSLVAGGHFVIADDQLAERVARFENGAWHPMGGDCNGDVRALAAWNGQLVVGGEFTRVGGIDANYNAVWNGTSWAAFAPAMNGRVNALCVSGGDVYIGGAFSFTSGSVQLNRVAAWNGQRYRNLSAGVNNEVLSIDRFGALLAFGGVFANANGVAANHVALLDPSTATWSALGTGISGGPVHSICSHAGRLFAAGEFFDAGAIRPWNIAAWEGAQWTNVGHGFNDQVNRLGVFNGQLVAAGFMTHADGRACGRLAAWSGSAWSTIGGGFNESSASPLALAEIGGSLVVSGVFASAGSPPQQTGPLAAWDGVAWRPFRANGPTSGVFTFLEDNGTTYVGGHFSNIGAQGINNIAKFANGQWSALGNGTNDTVNCIAKLGTRVVVGGSFTSVDGRLANRVAAWNPETSTWSALGDGFDGEVFSLKTYHGSLYACGSFRFSGGQPRNGVARWDGTAWQPLGLGVDGVVNTMCEFEGDLYVAGSFGAAGGGTPGTFNCIARWNDATQLWSPLGTGIEGNQAAVFDMRVHENQLVVCGRFTSAGGVVSRFIARWGSSCQCAADLDNGSRLGNADGAVTIDDLLFMLLAFEAGAAGADLDDGSRTGTRDGAVTIEDLVFFLVHFEDGC